MLSMSLALMAAKDSVLAMGDSGFEPGTAREDSAYLTAQSSASFLPSAKPSNAAAQYEPLVTPRAGRSFGVVRSSR